MTTQTWIRRVLPRFAIAALAALVTVALAAPAAAQASRTRPSGGSSGHASGGSSGGGTSVSVHGSSGHYSGSSGGSASRTRPPSGHGSSPAVIEHDRRRGGGGFRHGGGYPYYDYDPFYLSFGFGYPYSYVGWGWPYWNPYWNWGPYYGGLWWDFDYRYPHGAGGVTVYPGQTGPGMGALDLDVWPAKTEVYVDGQYVGVVDNFDGWPRYLWLDQGTYDIVFYMDGFKTLARQYTIYPGRVIDVDDRMQPGESVRPEDLASKSTVRRDERERQEREQQAAAAAGGGGWQDRVRNERAEMGVSKSDDAVASGQVVDARAEPGRVHLAVDPDDAAVYLDGRFLGTGRELAKLGSGLIVDPGSHKLSVVRPGRESKSVDFQVAAGEEVDLNVELAAAPG